MPRKAVPVNLSESEVTRLEQWVRSGSTPQQVVLRCRVILAAANGEQDKKIAGTLGIKRRTAARWRHRACQHGIGCVWEIAQGRGRKATIGAKKIAKIVEATLHAHPPGATHWSTRTLAAAQGVSKNTVHRLWQDQNLKPHLRRSFKLSRDPRFLEKLTDVVGVYLTPPQNAVVLCVDEKSQIQALERTQPMLPMGLGYVEGVTHDYRRHGTTTLFAALQMVEGRVIGECYPRHRHQEFLRFLRRLDVEFPETTTLHLILDNYGTHGHDNVEAWLAKHPRFHFHFTPTSSSWLNLVERWFRDLTDKAIRRGVFRSVPELIAAIEAYLAAHNKDPKPFIWTASADEILEKVRRGRVALGRITA